MAEHFYEGMFLLDANRYARDPSGVSAQVPELITKCGGDVLASRFWNEQRLAYPIKGQRKGTYWLTYFRMDSSHVATLNRESKLNENVLRSLVLKVDPKLVDAMVEHAKGSSEEEAPSEQATPS